jgi:hypothetical protein
MILVTGKISISKLYADTMFGKIRILNGYIVDK